MLAFNLFQPVTDAMLGLLNAIHSVVPSYGLDMILLALVVRLSLFPLAQQQFKSMAEMQKAAAAAQEIASEEQRQPARAASADDGALQRARRQPAGRLLPDADPAADPAGLVLRDHTRRSGRNSPTAGASLWIGSPLSHGVTRNIFATSLATLDMSLFVLYVVSMYISVRYGSPPSSDPQQAQTQKIMAIVSPLMIAYFGYKYQWASALLIYWLALNVFTMAQQFYMYRKLRDDRAEEAAVLEGDGTAALPRGQREERRGRQTTGRPKNGSTSGRAQRRSKR